MNRTRSIARIFLLLLSAVVWTACVDDEPAGPAPDLGYEYFPLETGSYLEYRVDSIYHDQPSPDIPGIHDTSHYFVREVMRDFITDGVGDPVIRIERYKRNHDTLTWSIADVWTAKLTSHNAQRVEENRRYVKLGFPVAAQTEWDANALNNREAWACSYDSIGLARDIGDLSFPQTVRVNQRDFKNLIDDEFAYEVYARGVGLIRKYHRDLTTQVNYVNNPVAENIRYGYEYHLEIMDYGKE